jgi:hypothetical protein
MVKYTEIATARSRNSVAGILSSYALKSSFTKDLGDAFKHGPQRHRILLQIIISYWCEIMKVCLIVNL